MSESLYARTHESSLAQSKRLIRIAWIFSAIIILILAFAYYGIGLMSSARAYVGGEGAWSKAQKDMVYNLARYAHYHNALDYSAFLTSSKVNLGDRQARVELEKERPDFALVRAGFLKGRNHADDIDGMIRLFRTFRTIPDIDKAIGIWARADVHIEQLIALSEKVHLQVQAGRVRHGEMLPHLQELSSINQRLAPLEDEFSATLGDAARKMQLLLLVTLFFGASVMLAGAFLISRRLVHQSIDVELALRAGEQQLQRLLRLAPLPIIITRIGDESILFANDHAKLQFKLEQETLAVLPASAFFKLPSDREALITHLRAHRCANDWEIVMADAHGREFWASLSCQSILFDGQDCVLTALKNIDVVKRHAQELNRRAFHDELTDLPNRAYFKSVLADTFKTASSEGSSFALMFLDIDSFKAINDRLGHAVGDQLLQEVARRLKASVSTSEVVTRLGGDEFVILITRNADPVSLEKTATRIMETMRVPVSLESCAISVTVSMGISCYPEDGSDSTVMMKNADRAMYHAKEQGRNTFRRFNEIVAAGHPAGL